MGKFFRKMASAIGRHRRKIVQLGWGLLSNAYVQGFLPGGPNLYEGGLKRVCVPGLNCYSCPGALGSCPVGALQNALSARRLKFPFYVLGYLIAIGMLAGRLICGWLCIFGLIQELLYKIPTPKLKIPEKIDRPLRWLKYIVLAVLVIGLPLFWRDEFGSGAPFFCEYLCPVGTLQGGIPQVLMNDVGTGLAVPVEDGNPDAVCAELHIHLPAVLQVSVPPGRVLLPVPEGEHRPDEGGYRCLRGLRRLRESMRDERGSA